MKTACTGVDISSYEFGLVCIDDADAAVRHLFGKGSFDPEETFDTLVPCARCLGLEAPKDEALTATMELKVDALATEVRGLKDVVSDLSGDIAKLNDKVFATTAPPLPPTTPATTPEVPEPEVKPNHILLSREHIEQDDEEDVADTRDVPDDIPVPPTEDLADTRDAPDGIPIPPTTGFLIRPSHTHQHPQRHRHQAHKKRNLHLRQHRLAVVKEARALLSEEEAADEEAAPAEASAATEEDEAPVLAAAPAPAPAARASTASEDADADADADDAPKKETVASDAATEDDEDQEEDAGDA